MGHLLEVDAHYDPNGVRQIYSTRTGRAEPWTLGYDSWRARAISFEEVSGSGRETTVRGSGQVRMMISATASECAGATDQGAALRQGYMCSRDDWTNYEYTAYLKLDNAASDEDDRWFSLFGGGGIHSGHGAPRGCRGSAYISSYHYKQGLVRFGKESWHVRYDDRDWHEVPGAIDYVQNRSKWLGMKVVKYEFERHDKRGVRSELWLDFGGIRSSGEPENKWVLALVEEDHPEQPSWGSQATRCEAPRDNQIMFWGGPYVTVRWDNSGARVKLMTVREIRPPADVPPP